MHAAWMPARVHAPEFLDSPSDHADGIDSNLRDIRRLNRWFGGTRQAVQCVERVTHGYRSVRLLDVASGSGDIPEALLRWAQRSTMSIDVTACDVSPEVLRVARRRLSGTDVRLARADASALPWPDGHFDVVLLCLALHHFDRPQALTVLREMWRVASVAIVVTDLRREYAAWAATWAATRVLTSNPLTRHDGPLSVRRAYTVREVNEMAREAGIAGPEVRPCPFFRQSLVAFKPGTSSHA